jgi:putative membrane protein
MLQNTTETGRRAHSIAETCALTGLGRDTVYTAIRDGHLVARNDELKEKTGKDFDQSYDQIQVKAHEDAVALFEAYAREGDNADLKKWAAATLPHLKQHLKMAQKLK